MLSVPSKEFTIAEMADLSLCLQMCLLPMAFADNAFLAEFTDVEQIYKIVIPPWKDRIIIDWKEEWRGRPIARDVERTPDGIRISDTEPFSYDQYRNAFRNLGRECGLERLPELYDLRRAGGKVITGETIATPSLAL
jgi:hypothetical protein